MPLLAPLGRVELPVGLVSECGFVHTRAHNDGYFPAKHPADA